jgi:hypothetical protein
VAQSSTSPQTVTSDPLARLSAALSEIYFRPPAVWDVPFYLSQLAPQAEAYFARPLEHLTAWPVWGVLMAGLGVAGLASSGERLWQDRLSEATRAEQTLWWWLTGVLGVVLLTTPFDWQRYFILLVPPACMFAALALERFARLAGNRMLKATTRPDR